jgi:hypothetical protein
MRVQRLPLPPGNHELEGPVEDSRLGSVLLEDGLANLVLTVGTPRTEVLVAPAGQTATTLVILVGEKAALKLRSDLDALARTMGWPTPPGAGGQDEMQRVVTTQPRRR